MHFKSYIGPDTPTHESHAAYLRQLRDNILPQVKSVIDYKLKEVQNYFTKAKVKSVFNLACQQRIENYFKNPNDIKPYIIPDLPMGSPIGSHCDTQLK